MKYQTRICLLGLLFLCGEAVAKRRRTGGYSSGGVADEIFLGIILIAAVIALVTLVINFFKNHGELIGTLIAFLQHLFIAYGLIMANFCYFGDPKEPQCEKLLDYSPWWIVAVDLMAIAVLVGYLYRRGKTRRKEQIRR